MKKQFRLLLFAIYLSALPLLGNEDFFVVSSSAKKDGNLYKVSGGKAELLCTLPTLNYLINSPDGKFLYGTMNRTGKKGDKNGALAVFKKNKAGVPELFNIYPLNAATPCHLAVSPDGNFIYTANYSSGDLTEIVLRNGIPQLPFRKIPHSGNSIDPRRQRSPHPHFTGFNPAGGQLFVCDLGCDEIVIYNISKNGASLPPAGKLKLPPGSGPRHLAFSPCGNIIYVANELSSTVTSLKNINGSWRLIKTVSTRTVPTGSSKNFPGAIKISGNGRYIFVTNRGDDNIAILTALPGGDIKLIKTIASHGKYPSDILLKQQGNDLTVANLKSGNIVRFKSKTTPVELTPASDPLPVNRAAALCR